MSCVMVCFWFGMADEARFVLLRCGKDSCGSVFFIHSKKIIMKNVNWKLKGFGKNVDPQKAVDEIERIKRIYGAITAENIVSEAQKPDCILHALFEWDDTKAAEQFRLQQARNLINNIVVTVVHNNEKKEVGAYEIATISGERQYTSIDTLTMQDVEEIKKVVLRELNYLKNKLSFYSDLKPTIEHLTNAEKSLVG